MDAINPDHYKRLPAEAIEIIEAMIAGAPDNKAAYLHGQAAKYDLRLWKKGESLEDFLSDWGKHIWYALRLESYLIELIEKQKADEQQKASDLQSLKDHPFGKLKKASLSSDKIPEGYRKLNDSSEEPRQLGDLRWSVSEKRHIPISSDEIGYANRDNWAACRKIEPAIKQSLITEPPDGWRWLEVGEKFFLGDTTVDGDGNPYLKSKISKQYCERHACQMSKTFIRRNRFEVGEKVVHVGDKDPIVYIVNGTRGDKQVLSSFKNIKYALYPNNLAPYIEEQL